MPIDERSISLPEQWAKDAQTVIPAPPVPGIAYRNTAITPEQWAHGQDYSRVADSAQWNQMFWTMSGLLKDSERYGIMPYSGFTNYETGGLCLGPDGEVYQALQQSGPIYGGPQPVSNALYWLQKYSGVFEQYTGATPLSDIVANKLRPGRWYWINISTYPSVVEKPNINLDPGFSVLFYFVQSPTNGGYYRIFWYATAIGTTGEVVANNTWDNVTNAWQGWKRVDQGAMYATTSKTTYAVPASGGVVIALGSGWMRFVADATVNNAAINLTTPIGARVMGYSGMRIITYAPVVRGANVIVDYSGVSPIELAIFTTLGGK